ncbi:MAG: DUF47 family protein [Nitrospirae bacterium]|nr:DUF47 family protein [Nitrospirota bacterium]
MFFGKSKDEAIQKAFISHIGNTNECARDLINLCDSDTPATITTMIQRMLEKEHQGDKLTEHIHLMLENAFITKIDKDDIVNLANYLDDIVDKMKIVARLYHAYRITKMRDEGKELAMIILQMVQILQQMINGLPKHNTDSIKGMVYEIKKFEESADTVLYKALEALHSKEYDYKVVLEWRDIFRALEETTDCCDRVCGVVSAIVRKAN